eukprot:g6241.t1
MPIFALYVKAECDGIAAFRATGAWCVTLQQGGGEERREEVFIDAENEEEVEGSRGTFNFVCSFAGARSKATINVLPCTDAKCKALFQKLGDDAGSWTPAAAEKCDDDGFVPVVAFDMRGCDFVDWHPHGQTFVAVSAGGTEFHDDVDLHEDWAEYDESANVSVEIMDLKHKIERV